MSDKTQRRPEEVPRGVVEPSRAEPMRCGAMRRARRYPLYICSYLLLNGESASLAALRLPLIVAVDLLLQCGKRHATGRVGVYLEIHGSIFFSNCFRNFYDVAMQLLQTVPVSRLFLREPAQGGMRSSHQVLF